MHACCDACVSDWARDASNTQPSSPPPPAAACPRSPASLQKLKILEVAPGASEDEGYVRFQAWFKTRGQLGQRAQGSHTQSFVERSRFLRDGAGGRWLYVDGDQDWQKK